MTAEIPRTEELTSFADADAAVDRCAALLKSIGIEIQPGSDLERGCLAVKYLADYFKKIEQGVTLPPWPGKDMRDDLQIGLSIHNLVQLVLAYSNNPNIGQLTAHLRLHSCGAAAQTKRAPVTDQASNKMVELRVALACLKTGTDLQMEDPNGSGKARNPDVLVRMSDKKLWGFACKVVHGDSPQSLWESFEKGVTQIELSKADTGLVVISFKNKLEHDELFPKLGIDGEGDPVLGALPTHKIAVERHASFIHGKVVEMVAAVTREQIASRLLDSKVLPAIAVPVETVIGLRTNRGVIPSLVSYLQLLPLEAEPKRIDAAAVKITGEINLGLVGGRQIPR